MLEYIHLIESAPGKKIIKIAKELLEVLDFQGKPRLLKDQLDINLTKDEFDYLTNAPFLPKKCRKFRFSPPYLEGVVVKIYPHDADEIRTLCSIQLQVNGYDEKKELTPEGKLLESIIEKLFVGFYKVER